MISVFLLSEPQNLRTLTTSLDNEEHHEPHDSLVITIEVTLHWIEERSPGETFLPLLYREGRPRPQAVVLLL